MIMTFIIESAFRSQEPAGLIGQIAELRFRIPGTSRYGMDSSRLFQFSIPLYGLQGAESIIAQRYRRTFTIQ